MLRSRSNGENSGCIEILAAAGCILLMILTLPFSLFIRFKVVAECERAFIFQMGRANGAIGPGVYFVLPCIDNYCKVDLRNVSFDVPLREVLSKDSVTVSVDAVVNYCISDPLKAVIQVANYSHSTRLLAATTLRNVLDTRNLSELLNEREVISYTMLMSLDDATDPWGVERVEIRVSSNCTGTCYAEAEASREARTKVIAAEGEMKSPRALKEASDFMCESPASSSYVIYRHSTVLHSKRIPQIFFRCQLTCSKGLCQNEH